jgi:hypothetical protein
MFTPVASHTALSRRVWVKISVDSESIHLARVALVAFSESAGDMLLGMEELGGVPAMKAMIAHYRNDAEWDRGIPPLVELSDSHPLILMRHLNQAGFDWLYLAGSVS